MEKFSHDFVYKKFSEFYRDPSAEILLPASVNQREFAYLLLKERVMVRHRGFGSVNGFRLFLNETVPSDVYHSCAYYENPKAEMAKKGWLGADLVFDIDADHIPTSCNKIHDEWTCGKCGFNGKGITPDFCPNCKSKKFETKTWPCEVCLNSAKEETSKLIEMLKNDFGFTNEELHVFFSGHRGYHVHVENEAVKALDATARKEIVDHISGLGLVIAQRVVRRKPNQKLAAPRFSLHDFGWNKRLKLGIKRFILDAGEEDFKNAGVTKRVAKTILQSKSAVLKRCLDDGRWDSVKGVGESTWFKLAEFVKEKASANIDTVVTTDIHRLIRMAGTLHGKTGLKKVEFPVARLADFNPFKEAVAFKEGEVKVSVSDVPKFRLGGKVHGPYRQQEVTLPTAAAVLLICKGRAEVVK